MIKFNRNLELQEIGEKNTTKKASLIVYECKPHTIRLSLNVEGGYLQI